MNAVIERPIALNFSFFSLAGSNSFCGVGRTFVQLDWLDYPQSRYYFIDVADVIETAAYVPRFVWINCFLPTPSLPASSEKARMLVSFGATAIIIRFFPFLIIPLNHVFHFSIASFQLLVDRSWPPSATALCTHPGTEIRHGLFYNEPSYIFCASTQWTTLIDRDSRGAEKFRTNQFRNRFFEGF